MHTRLTTGIAISIAAAALTLIALECVGFVWEQRTAQSPLGWTLVASRRMPLQHQSGSVNGVYTLRPGSHYLWEGMPVEINSQGFRTEEFVVPKPPGTFRILNVGDSTVFGWKVLRRETFGKLLEANLNLRSAGTRYEVINSGVPGWAVEDYRDFVVETGLGFDPDLVVLTITVVNDIYGRSPSSKDSPALLRWLRDETYFWPFVTINTRLFLAEVRGPEAIPALTPPANPADYFPLAEADPSWETVWAPVSEIVSLCRSQGTRVILILFPSAFQVRDEHPSLPQSVFGKRARADGIEFVDLLPIYQDVCKSVGTESCAGYENHLFADAWMHPNAEGHRVAADVLVERLEPMVFSAASPGNGQVRQSSALSESLTQPK